MPGHDATPVSPEQAPLVPRQPGENPSAGAAEAAPGVTLTFWQRLLQSAKGFVERLWRGELPLAVTFWGFGVLGSLILYVPFFIERTGAFNHPHNLITLTLSINAAAAALAAYTLFMAFAIWRSADGYRGPLIWTVMAKVIVILRLLPMAVGFLKFFLPEP